MRNINLRYVDETYDDDGALQTFSVHFPDDFNFGYDVVDDIGVNDPDRRAMLWCNPEGEEHLFTFADMKRWSDKTANFLAAQGIGRGDYVMVILRRHYQFWFVATALAKLGCVMVPATFMLKEHDLDYRLNGASIKAVIATSVGDIAQIVDNVIDRCPTITSRILVNGAGGGLTPRDPSGKLDVPEGIKGENIPEPGIPESFKVLLKELQSLGLDVRVLRDDNTEVEIMETSDMGDADFRSLLEGDRKYRHDEDLGAAGYTEQEFQGEELVDIEEPEDDFSFDFAEADDFDSYDDNYDNM